MDGKYNIKKNKNDQLDILNLTCTSHLPFADLYSQSNHRIAEQHLNDLFLHLNIF